ncbi:rod shape-determining protein MreC [Tissierella creatinophila]|uniref:Cell shape-determining protein MreC n=1 Tax=Tissierella creatinophila DSM 6911 TaxID=1123403 RepID=A0A1U7M7L4_TISCR|nr:rod shape-determining protein MreC [Tissierella creatinophila]OLS03324.1 cell shape-determining protein MreC precursor [Tissierella creatinophila DSM 6911]
MYFFKKYKNKMIVTLVTIILIITVGITNKRNSDITGAENFLGNIFSPVNKFFYSIGNKVSHSFGNVGDLFTLQEEKEKLQTEVLRLEDENRKLENIISKSDFLKAEAELLKTTDRNLMSAEIISKEPGNWYNKFTIDKGKKDGIKKDTIIIQGIKLEDGVIHEGLVGRVTKVGDNSSKVSAIIDEENSISFKVIRTQDGGIVKGSIDSDMEGFLFDRKADVIVGDQLYTSGLGKAYEKDLYIGEVEDVVQLEEELMKKIIVKPAIDFKKIYKVFAIIE